MGAAAEPGPLTPRLPRPEFVTAPDGVRLAYRVLGDGAPVVLLHGFFSSGAANWIGAGHAARLLAAGHRLIVPDVRGHGRSDRPIGPGAYPPDVLVDDVQVLVEQLGLTRFDVAGYSLGSRTAARLATRGLPVGRLVLGGQGLDTLTNPPGHARGGFLRPLLDGEIDPGSATQQWFVQQWHRRPGTERAALLQLLDSSLPTSPAELAAIGVPTLVVSGDHDDPADGQALAAALPAGRFLEVPGDHVTAAGSADFGAAMTDYLTAGRTNS